jgi:hypothetical protein
MTITKEELERTFSHKSSLELLAILGDKENYTPNAVEVARELVEARGLFKGDLEEYKSDVILRMDEAYRREHFVDLRWYEKVLCYVAGPILVTGINLYLFMRPYLGMKDGRTLRLSQTLLFVWSGFTVLILAAILADILGTTAGLVGWLAFGAVVFWWDRKAVARRKAEYDRIYGPSSGGMGQALAKG